MTEEEVLAPPSFLPVKAIDVDGQIIELVRPDTAQEAVSWASKARKVVSAVRDYTGFLETEAIRLLQKEGATAVLGDDGRTFALGTENRYGPVNAGRLREELLAYANNPETVGGMALAEKIAKAFQWVEPPTPDPYWQTDNRSLNSLEAFSGLGEIVRKHRHVSPETVLRERK